MKKNVAYSLEIAKHCVFPKLAESVSEQFLQGKECGIVFMSIMIEEKKN